MITKTGTTDVSVVMNVCNGEAYVKEAVESILKQTCENFDFVIVDDGSVDGTWDILKSYAGKDSRIALMRNEVNKGIYVSANRGIQAARGRYIARTDADDISDPSRLELQKLYLDGHPDAALVCANWMWESEVRGRRVPSNLPVSDILSAWYLLFYNHFACQSAVMFRRDEVLAMGGYNEKLPVTGDYELWVRLGLQHRLGVIPETLVRFRRDLPGSVTVEHVSKQRQVAALVSSRAVMLLTEDEKAFNPEDFWSFWPVYWKRPYPAPNRAEEFHRNLIPIYRAFVQHWGKRFPEEHNEADILIRESIASAFRLWAADCAATQPESSARIALYADRWAAVKEEILCVEG